MDTFDLSKINEIFSDLSKEFIVHSHGLFILAPSGVGKTYFINKQSQKHWIDGDYLWDVTGADYLSNAWEYDFNKVQDVNKRSDAVTKIAKENGFRVLGSSNYDLKPDAIVLPEWKVHKARILKREREASRSSGATSKDLKGVISHRKWIAMWEDKGVPKFTNIEDAINYLKINYSD